MLVNTQIFEYGDNYIIFKISTFFCNFYTQNFKNKIKYTCLSIPKIWKHNCVGFI
jgi:hypothetical protein